MRIIKQKRSKMLQKFKPEYKVYYFSKFNSREYFPVLNEFAVSANTASIGGQPIADAYFNMKVKRMLIYAEAQTCKHYFYEKQIIRCSQLSYL